MPGFMDKVKKGLNDAAAGINKAVSDVQSGSSSASPPPGGAPAGAGYVDPTFVDATDPQGWLTPERLASLMAEDLHQPLSFGPPQQFATDDAVVARFTSADGAFTVDIGSVNEEILIAHGGQVQVIDAYQRELHDTDPVDVGDRAVVGTTGPGHARLVVCAGDMAARFDVYGPATSEPAHLATALVSVATSALKLDVEVGPTPAAPPPAPGVVGPPPPPGAVAAGAAPPAPGTVAGGVASPPPAPGTVSPPPAPGTVSPPPAPGTVSPPPAPGTVSPPPAPGTVSPPPAPGVVGPPPAPGVVGPPPPPGAVGAAPPPAPDAAAEQTVDDQPTPPPPPGTVGS